MTSKPSTTNCPKTFFQVHTFNCIVVNETTEQQNNKTTKQQFYKYSFVQSIVNLISGGYCGGVPPLPIPNREVKPTCADGTAMQCGRVGRRLLSMKSLRFRKISEAFLFLVSRRFMFFMYSDIFYYYILFVIILSKFLLFKHILLFFLFFLKKIAFLCFYFTAVPFRNLPVRIDSAYSNRLTLSREHSC